MKRRLKRKSNKRILFIILGSTAALIIVVLLNLNYLNKLRVDYIDKINALTTEYKAKEVRVYQAKEHILAGSILTIDNVLERIVVSEQNSEYYMTSENIGNVTLVDIEEGSWIYKDMLREEVIIDNVREVEYSTFFIGNNINQNDYFDLHIQYPNGEDYIVLSKNLMKRVDETNQYIYLWLAPEELFNISGAIVDCYLNEGARLYSVKYIEPTIQKASILTYTPNNDIINIMKKDPNIVNTAIYALNGQVRMELEERLHLFYSEHENYEVNKQDSIYYPNKSIGTRKENNTADNSQESLKIEATTDNNIVNTGTTNNEVINNEVINNGVAKENGTKEEEVYYVD